jgi:hypothetical protein
MGLRLGRCLDSFDWAQRRLEKEKGIGKKGKRKRLRPNGRPLPEGKVQGLDAGIEEFDFEGAIYDGAFLAD